MIDEPFANLEIVWAYRFAHETGDKETAAHLRQVWKQLQGEDSLHEMAFDEPITREDAERFKQQLVARLSHLEAWLAWLKTVETV